MKRLVLIGACTLVLAACGGGGTSDVDQVKHVWTSFFSAQTDASEKPAMLQNGAKFAAAIQSLAGNPLAAHLSSKVSTVTLERSNKAKVVFSIYLGNTAVLTNKTGYAYKENGKWLVGSAVLCGLLAQYETPPAACTS